MLSERTEDGRQTIRMEVEDGSIETLINRESIENRVSQLASELLQDYGNEPVLLVGILNGAATFLSDLHRQLPLNFIVDYMGVASYGSGTESSGSPSINRDLKIDPKGKRVVIVEDIADTGYTLETLINILKARGARGVEVCALLSKDEQRKVEGLDVKYIGFHIPNKFVVGYGLDYNERYRNLPYIGVLTLKE